jgi:death-on-curing protein
VASKAAVEPTFLTLDEVLEIHQEQIEKYGGSAGLRDAGALESAIATPMATFAEEYLHATIPAMAAAYLFHITRNHPFLDGNKRVGANAAITFLRMNDWEPTFSEDELVDGFGGGRWKDRQARGHCLPQTALTPGS